MREVQFSLFIDEKFCLSVKYTFVPCSRKQLYNLLLSMGENQLSQSELPEVQCESLLLSPLASWDFSNFFLNFDLCGLAP